MTDYSFKPDFLQIGDPQQPSLPVYTPLVNGLGDDALLGTYPRMVGDEAVQILNGALLAYDKGRGEWPSCGYGKRIDVMRQFIAELGKYRERVIRSIIWEIAKTTADATIEFDRTIDYLEQTCVAYEEMFVKPIRTRSSGIATSTKPGPIGVGLCMGPSNYPHNELWTSAGPMLLSGNCVIIKHAKAGILLNKYVQEAAEAVFPKGTVNFLWGKSEELIKPIAETGNISILSFIGGTRAANAIINLFPNRSTLRVVLGLGAKNIGVGLENCIFDPILDEILKGVASYNQQRCTGLKQLMVSTSRRVEFMEKLLSKLRSKRAGMPYEDGAYYTPLVSIDDKKRMQRYVDDAVAKGAILHQVAPWNVETSGPEPETYFNFTVLEGVTLDMDIAHEEQFGPVLPIMFYDSINEVKEYHYNSQFGQQVSIFDGQGGSSKPALELADALVNDVSRVNLDHTCMRGPDDVIFIGIKGSALRGLSLKQAILEFSTTCTLSVKEKYEYLLDC